MRLSGRLLVGLGGVAVAIGWGAAPAAALNRDFVAFESDQVRPLALSPDGTRLFVANTPDGRLEIFDVGTEGLVPAGSTPVGLEPVAVAARSNSEVWVVNHLSDSVSIVDVSSNPPRVVRTLLLCDEPRDIVFGGTGFTRAFITSARRGQNCPVPALSTTEGIGRALVTVYDATAVGPGLGGAPLTVIELFSDKPRALTVSSDGATVYAAAFHSGNQTTSVHELAVCDGGVDAPPCSHDGVMFPGGLPLPNENVEGAPQPEEGLIVRYDPILGIWKDELERSWNDYVRFNLPDEDVFAISANGAPPSVTQTYNSVGTVLYNMAVNPVSGKVYVSNTEAINEVRFVTNSTLGNSRLRGRQHEARITVLDGTSVVPRHLNKHIDYDMIPVPAGVLEKSLATPLGIEVSADGQTLYVTAFSSNKIGVLSADAVENDTFVPSAQDHISVPGGPTGLALDETRQRAYVLTRYDNSVVVVDLGTAQEISRTALPNPESRVTTDGRPFLYDASISSSNGEASCASCHVFGDSDSLAWDLGDATEPVIPNPNPAIPPQMPEDFHPLKGPMVTMSLRGMANHGPLHMRGDRTGALDDPPTDALNVVSSFRTFNGAFAGLLGRDEGPIDNDDMSKFAAFAERITYPPNPIRSLDNSLNPSEQRGRDLYHERIVFNTLQAHTTCQGCHPVSPSAGLFGTDGKMTPGVNDWYKTPHFRNLYQRIGMFGMVVVPLTPAIPLFESGDNAHTGDQVRGFGFEHAGAVDTVFRFNRYFLFSYRAANAAEREQQRRDLEAYMLAIETDMAPVVGQQVTLNDTNGATAGPRIDLLMARANAVYPNLRNPFSPECELVVKGSVGGEMRGWLYRDSIFYADRVGETIDDTFLRSVAATAGQELTYTCVPPGSGLRVALDRDADGVLDGDERDRGMDSAVPDRIPGGGRKATDCGATFTVINPTNTPLQDGRGRLRNAQRCHDGDPLCDTDGVVDGKCVFDIRACFNTATDRCTPTSTSSWAIRAPRLNSRREVDVENANAVRDAVLGLDFGATPGADPRTILFPSPLANVQTCTDPIAFTVPLRGPGLIQSGRGRLVTRAFGPAGEKDQDRLLLFCMPAAPQS